VIAMPPTNGAGVDDDVASVRAERHRVDAAEINGPGPRRARHQVSIVANMFLKRRDLHTLRPVRSAVAGHHKDRVRLRLLRDMVRATFILLVDMPSEQGN
jgi:hypothetical protein